MKKNIYSFAAILFILTVLSQNTFAQGWWYRKADCDLSARTAAISFSIGTGGFLATGFDSSSFRRQISVYNTTNDTWTQLQSMGGVTGSGLGRDAAASFSIGNKGYVVMGQGSNPFLNDTWEYDAGSDAWTQKANFSGTPRRSSVGFAVNNKGYITCGQTSAGFSNETWMYDPTTNSWTMKAAFPGTPRRLPIAFVIGGNAFVGTGDDGGFKNDFYQYNAISDAWAVKANFGGTPRYGAAAFVIGTDGYVGTGYDNTLSNTKDFWKYNSVSNSWVQVQDFAGTARSNAVTFSIGSYGYLATGYDSLPAKDLWKYDPLSNGVDEIAKFKSSVNVYPNPMIAGATIKFDERSLEAFNNISFMLFDINGRQLKNVTNIRSSELSIDRGDMSAGIYIYKIVADNYLIKSGKLIVQ